MKVLTERSELVEQYNKGNILQSILIQVDKIEYCSDENITLIPDRWKYEIVVNPDNTINMWW